MAPSRSEAPCKEFTMPTACKAALNELDSLSDGGKARYPNTAVGPPSAPKSLLAGLTRMGKAKTYAEDPLLAQERRQSQVPVRTMEVLLAGGEDQLHSRIALTELVESDPILGDWDKRIEEFFRGSDRAWLIKRNLQKIHRIAELVEEQQLDKMSEFMLKYYFVGAGGLLLHDTVFMPTIMSMTTDAQLAAWLPKVLSNEWIGCYAQTEMEHGSNVRGLQTTCTFVEDTDEFEVHTPTLGATKWWPGALGVLSTHAVLYARLIVRGKDLGIHNFLVQIRSVEDHKPLPGIEVGDIGPKWGTNSNDNGFLRFSHVRIPRFNMFMKYAKLTKQGEYSRPGPAKGAYGTMTRVRANIVSGSSRGLAKAITIAIRYSAVRRQEPGAQVERPVLDYLSQQYRLLPILATAYALHFIGKQMLVDYVAADEQQRGGDYSSAAVLHATSCSLKSLCTTITADGIEEARRACGGHGFHMFSGLPDIYTSFMPSFTAEGDNWLLTQQTSRFLLKLYRGEAQAVAGAAYLSREAVSQLQLRVCSATSPRELLDVATMIQAFQQRAGGLVASLASRMAAMAASGVPDKDVWTAHLVDHYKVSRAHGLVNMVNAFAAAMDGLDSSQQELQKPMRNLFFLFCLNWIEKDRGEFYESGFFSPKRHHTVLAEATSAMLHAVRPDAIPLTDAFGLSDFQLHSALGCHDGNYVQRLFEWAKRDPLNSSGQQQLGGDAIDGYRQYLRPTMHKASL